MKTQKRKYKLKHKSIKNKTQNTKLNKNKMHAGSSGKKNTKVNCSPKPKNEINDFTCYTDKALFKLRDLWNARHPDAKINTNSPKEIHNALQAKFQNVCSKESCWLKQKSVLGNVGSDIADSFAPESPVEWKHNQNEWLSSEDIMKVMKQYEKAYKCFDFIGPSPIDFDTKMLYGECVWDELCNFDLAKQIKDGKTKIGVIFNTDPHNKPGQHWISLFINIKNKKIFFFDSTGDKMPEQIKKFIERVKKQGLSQTPQIHFKSDSNEGIEHQYGNTECGMYSLFFIVHMLEDKTTEHYLKTHILKDKYMEKFRHVYFNDSLI
jgi:hypothetical protein